MADLKEEQLKNRSIIDLIIKTESKLNEAKKAPHKPKSKSLSKANLV